MISAIVDLLITAGTKLFLGFAFASGNAKLIIFATFVFMWVGPIVYGVLFGYELLSWVECYNNGDYFGMIITIGIFKFKR
jgi:hypothetical protein